MTYYSHAYLPCFITAIRAEQRTGSIRCLDDAAFFDLFFADGRLVHAETQPSDEQGEDALYSLLNVRNGKLLWHSGTPPMTVTVNADTESTFLSTMAMLQKRGVFLPIQPLDLDAPMTETHPVTVPPPPVVVTSVVTSSTPQFVFSFPTPQPTTLVPPPTFEEQVDMTRPVAGTFNKLRENQFSGYAVAGSALILFEVGQPTLARCDSLTSQDALNTMVRDNTPQNFRYFRSDIKMLAAFRALFGGHNAYANLQATTDTLSGLLGAFIRGHHTGTIVVRDPAQTLYYLIHSGTPCGLYAPDAAGMLRLLADRLSPGAEAQFDVYLTRDPEKIVLEEPVEVAPQVAPQVTSQLDTTLYNRALRTIVLLVGQMSSLQHAEFELNTVLAISRKQYPAVALLETGHETTEPTRSGAGSNNFRSGKSGALDSTAVSHVINTYLEPYTRRIGAGQLAAMLTRALGDELNHLQNAGVQIAALHESPNAPALATAASKGSAFDF